MLQTIKSGDIVEIHVLSEEWRRGCVESTGTLNQQQVDELTRRIVGEPDDFNVPDVKVGDTYYSVTLLDAKGAKNGSPRAFLAAQVRVPAP